jgi:predicted dehydrogenase
VADVDTQRAREVAPNTPAFASAAELVAAGDVDALVIATPAVSHLADADAAAAAGLPSLVEKPPAADAAQARLLAGLEPAPWIGFNRRFEPRLQDLREQLGGAEPLRLQLTFNYRRASWGAHTVADDPLLDVGIHLLDLARWLTGSDLLRVRALELTPRLCRLELELERGSASVSCANDRPYHEIVEVRDAEGAAVAAASRGGLVSAVRDRLGSTRASPLVESLTAELAAFCQGVHGGTAGTLATANDGVAAMTAVEGARRSAGLVGAWVDVSPDRRRD